MILQTTLCVSISVGTRVLLLVVGTLQIKNAVLLSTVTDSSHYEELEFYLKSGQDDNCSKISVYILWLKMVLGEEATNKMMLRRW